VTQVHRTSGAPDGSTAAKRDTDTGGRTGPRAAAEQATVPSNEPEAPGEAGASAQTGTRRGARRRSPPGTTAQRGHLTPTGQPPRDGQLPDAQPPDGQPPDWQLPDGQPPEGQLADGQPPDDGKQPDGQPHADGHQDGRPHAGLPDNGPAPGERPADPEASELIAAQVRGYVREHPGQRIAVLEAGCAPEDDLGLRQLCSNGLDTEQTAMDDDIPLTRATAAARTEADRVTLGDLRTIPLRQRSFDIVRCDRLLERIPHAELVLDRLVTALKPDGLLVLRITDRDCAAGFIDRTLPGPARMLLWRWLQPGRPGPFPAVYDRVVSARGIQLFALMRGLAIAVNRGLTVNPVSPDPRRRRFAALCRLVARISRGRITAGHDELLLVIRKPEDRTARLL
jgi:SAM-dependent methyltransferase